MLGVGPRGASERAKNELAAAPGVVQATEIDHPPCSLRSCPSHPLLSRPLIPFLRLSSLAAQVIAARHPLERPNRMYMDVKRGKREGQLTPGVPLFRFVGRNWLFEKVETWLDNEGGDRTMLLLADAGFGKSAFAAQLVDETMKDRILAYHFCVGGDDNMLNQVKFVEGLVVSLATASAGFRGELMKLVKEEDQKGGGGGVVR